jgi:hypothetical protein
MKNKLTVGIFILIILALGISIWAYFHTLIPQEKIIQFGTPQGDFAYDSRTPEEACATVFTEMTQETQDYTCALTNAERVDGGDAASMDAKCYGKASIAGCFSCTYTCETAPQ